MAEYTKPLPRGEDYNGEFYQFCKQRELCFQRCGDCRSWRHIPRESCPTCGSLDWRWERSSGKGKVFSWTVIHAALHPGFVQDVPYAVVVVELEEGVRLVTNLMDAHVNQLSLEMPVEVVFHDVTPEFTLPKFRPIGRIVTI